MGNDGKGGNLMKYPFTYKFEEGNLSIELEIESGVTLISGDSSTGKTFICEQIKGVIIEKSLRHEVNCNFPLDDTIVISNEIEFKKAMKSTNKLIFLDKVAMYDSPELADFINKRRNTFIVMYRKMKNKFNILQREIKELNYKVENDKIKISLSNI